jgi:lipopolysaccharide biosynthesis protein
VTNAAGQTLIRFAKRAAAKSIEIVGGLLFLLPVTQWLWRLKLGQSKKPATCNQRVAVVAHVFYPDLLPEVVACWRTVNEAAGYVTDLIVTTTPDRAGAIRVSAGEVPTLQIHVTVNRGRDIAPFMALLNDGVLARYDAVLKLHTKRSPHLLTGNLRRRLLYTLLAGNAAHVRRILELFETQRTGLVGWRLSFRRTTGWWMGNRARVTSLGARCQPPLDTAVGFFEGSMFWVRPAALAALTSLQLTANDYEPEAGQLDGALHHALERMFTLAAWRGGYTVHALTGETLQPGPAD